MVAKRFLVKPPAIYEIELRVEEELKPPARDLIKTILSGL